MKDYEIYELTSVKATAPGETETQDAILVHLKKDAFSDGDCILFGYSAEDFDCDDDITDALINNTPESCYTIDENGIYKCE